MKREKAQSLTEFALMLPILIVLITGIFALAILFHDWAQANSSAHNAVHAAAIHIVDGSGLSCQDRAQAAVGDPLFLMATEATFDIQPCSSDPYWIGAPGARVTGTWHLVVNPPVPFVYSNFGFPAAVDLRFIDTFR